MIIWKFKKGIFFNKKLKKMKAIVFSSYIPTKEALKVWIEFLEVFKEHFHDYDIYIWVNYGSIPEWEDVIKHYGNILKIQYGFVTKELSINSDVSWFQKALGLMKNENKKYDLVWFWHTKGATTNRDKIRQDMIENFFCQKERIEEYFDDKNMWIFWRYITTNPNLNFIDTNLSKLKEYSHNSANIFYLYTFYVIQWSVIYDFIKNCDAPFYHQHLIDYYGFDRYFFERDFPNIPTRYGYNFKYDIITHHPIWNINSKFKMKLFSEYRLHNKSIKMRILMAFFKTLNKITFSLYFLAEKTLSINSVDKYKNLLIKIFYKI